jgi:hypothetical protein
MGIADTQQLVLSVSEDNGRTWTNGIANGDVPLYFDPDRAPGISNAPDGTIDVAFYAAETAECGLTVETWRETLQAGWEDDCTYNVYHTFSPDGGQSFSTPLVLNDGGIVGQEFVKIDNRRQGGAPAVASTDEAAWVTWIEAGELYLRHVER